MFVIIESNILMEYPYLLRIGMPFYYLIPPLIYFYVSAILTEEPILKKSNLIHLFPFFVGLIDLSTYLLGSDLEGKIVEIQSIKSSEMNIFEICSGFIPAISHYYGRVLQSVFYLFLQWKLVFFALRHRKNKCNFKWILILTSSETLMYLGNLIFTIAVFYRREWRQGEWYSDLYYPLCYAMLLAFFFGVVYLFFSHGKLFGYKSEILQVLPSPALNFTDQEDENTKVLNPLLKQVEFLSRDGFDKVLDDYIRTHQFYLKKRAGIKDLAMALDLGHHLLSAFINYNYECNYNELINGYRIDYVLDGLDHNPQWQYFSISGLASEAGFSSRSTFYLAFKKKTGVSPALYIENKECIHS